MGYLSWNTKAKRQKIAFDAKTSFRYLNDDLSSFESQLLISTNIRIDFKYNWQMFVDDSNELNTEYFYIQTGQVLFRFAQSEKVQFRSGIGINNILFENNEGHFGFSYTYGLDFYPIKPIAGSLFMELGTIGHTGYTRARLELGYLHKNVGIILTFDYIGIGKEDIYGPGIGIRLNF